MNINIYIEDSLSQKLSKYSQKFHRKRNSIVREAIKDWLDNHTSNEWPESILEFKGIKDFPDIDEIRNDVIDKEKTLF